MGECSVDVPLWGDGGLLYGTSEEFVEALGPLGLSAGLAEDVVAWARDWMPDGGEQATESRSRKVAEGCPRTATRVGHSRPLRELQT
jgi:hypothetical protein